MFENKLVAVLNKNLEPGVAMNAIAHMTIGMGAAIGAQRLRLDNYQDKDGNLYPNISQMPFIVLRAKPNEIRKAVLKARENEIELGIFTDTMTGGTYQEQLDNTKQTAEDDIVFYGAVFFGDKDVVTEITKKFSLYK